jgi:SAM-dependent methyltransferase
MTDHDHRADDPDEAPTFDKDYWESHWRQTGGTGPGQAVGPNPYLVTETAGLPRGTALDAGCGEGAEALWLAEQGWQVTAVDISAEALARARRRGLGSPGSDRVTWVEADLSDWEPDQQHDLVASHYAHPAMPQLAFYDRLTGWVAPGGTLLIVGHLHTHDDAAHDHWQPPEETLVTTASITARLDSAQWDVVTAAEHVRTVTDREGEEVTLHDVVVRATRVASA